MPLPSLFSPQDITAMRNLARLSQSELAEALHYSHRTISAWERGRQSMTPATYIPFLDVIMQRFVLLGYLEEQKYHLLHITVAKHWTPPLSFAITVL